MDKPKTLDEAIKTLIDNIPEDSKQELRDGDIAIAAIHHTVGRGIRNDWGLWDINSDLHKHFKEMGIWHADDMSGIILESVIRTLKEEPIKLDEQIKFYRNFWEKNGGNEL